MSFEERVARREAVVGIVGLGYVGLPAAVEFADAGLRVIGYDIDAERVAGLNSGVSHILDVPTERLAPLVADGRFRATTNPSSFREADAVLICVPTPLNKTKDPDVSMVVNSGLAVREHLKRGALVVLESTVYPGYTREVLQAQLAEVGLAVGVDVFLAFSPERIDPGNPRFGFQNTPKVVGGITPTCRERVRALYGSVVDRVVTVSSTDCAEMVKLLENTFRAVNIGLVNEVAIMCNRLGLDTWEVIDAASSKPFGFMPFYPGPGLGGHCIPVDPHYLSWRLKHLDYSARFIELASEINTSMPRYVVQLVADALNERYKCINGSRVLVLGVAYKRDIADVRESPALDIMELLALRGADVEYHDPYVPELNYGGVLLQSTPDLSTIGSYDAVVVTTDHRSVDWEGVIRDAQLVIDTRNVSGRLEVPPGRVVRI